MSDSGLPKIVVVCGPTAVGKTTAAIDLAMAVQGEIVGADSLQIYRYLDIGTAKPTVEERAKVRHHLVDIRDPDEPFNAAVFKTLADEAIADIKGRNKVPIVVGGTGLYLRILIRGIFEAPEPDENLRQRLRAEINAYGIEHLHKRLFLVDPVLAAKVELHDKNRIMRGVEIFEQTGIPLSEHQNVHDFGKHSYEAFKIGVRMSREALYERIEVRTRQMYDQGLLQEYRNLRRRGYSADLKPMQSLGYRQMGDFDAGRRTLEQALADITRETKRYAKRQLTWFRKETDISWVDPAKTPMTAVAADVRRFLMGEPLALTWTCDPP